ncbi:peroxiredoxin [Thiomicrorhabdus sp.]|uniref:peroxiredoxin n=1 Tax=Thiomicrorhabdus sp. TaxID=2039724 RepID=UPI002AA9579A|nr:peroxiredoxin [Thiomicrorhabdus sp.]
MKKILITICFSLTSLLILSPQVKANELKIGDTAPDFQLLNQHGEKISLSSQRGHWVVLYFYPKDDTPGCTTEACSFRDNINKLIAQKAVILGVSVDDTASHKAFAEKHDLPFSLLADVNGDVARKYDAILDLKVIKFAKRNSFIIDKEGRIAKIYRDVNPREHVRIVMADLKKLQSVE